jgi:hypothetical protein
MYEDKRCNCNIEQRTLIFSLKIDKYLPWAPFKSLAGIATDKVEVDNNR